MFTDSRDFFDDLDDDQLAGFLDDDDEGLFDDDDPLGVTTATAFARVKRFQAVRVCKYRYAQEAAEKIGMIETDEHVDMIVSGDFIAGDFIEAFLEKNALVAEEILIATLSLSSDNVDSLKNIMKYYLSGNLGLIVSDYFFANERKDGIQDIIETLGGDRFFLAVAGVHVKITLIRTTCGAHIVMGGSANLRSSMNVEQVTIDNSKVLYDFHREWMSKILNAYHVQHKMLRRQPLWVMLNG